MPGVQTVTDCYSSQWMDALPEIGGHGSMFPYMYIRILTAANVLRALRASRERSACSQQTSEKLSSNWKHALETHG